MTEAITHWYPARKASLLLLLPKVGITFAADGQSWHHFCSPIDKVIPIRNTTGIDYSLWILRQS
jgi:hypothetical protein